MSQPAPAPSLRFGSFELLLGEQRLLADGQPVPLGGRAMDLLLALAQRPGRQVDKRTLMELVWPGLVVQENNLAAQISALRRVLGPDVIQTVPGRGYRFAARLEWPAQADAAPPAVGDSAAAADLAVASLGQRTNLPALLPPLLGRETELAELDALLATQRLVTLVGAGGIGKSLLAQHLLQRQRAAHAQGVCWVELGTVEAAALVGTVASAAGLQGGGREPLAALCGALAPLRMLLALDSAEHLLDAVAALVRSLLDAAPGLRIVLTSQAPLHLASEQLFRVGPLAVPEAALPAAQAQAHSAVQLFVQRAQAADGRFALGEANTATVVEICRALDGLPLAIELAAARAPVIGLQGLLGAMRERLKLLTANRNREAPPRQRTLRAALEWSHGWLDADAQQVFRRLAVIAGSGSLELVLQVAGAAEPGSGLDRWQVLDALDDLVDRSLVVVIGAHEDGEPRYRLLESPRSFALECLQAAGEEVATRRRHAQAMAGIFEAAYHAYYAAGTAIDDWVLATARDLDNARDALQQLRREGDRVREMRLAAGLLRALPPSLLAERLALAEACEAALDEDIEPALQLRVLLETSCAWGNTHKQRSHEAAQRALAIGRRPALHQSDPFRSYHALCLAAGAAAKLGELERAQALLEESRTLEDPAWPPQRLIWGTEAAQFVTHAQGDGAAALAQARQLVALDGRRGKDASMALGNLIDAELAAGHPEEAVRHGLALVARLQGTRHEFTLALTRLNLCAAQLALGQTAAAREVAQALWPQARYFDWPHYAACYFALLLALEGRAAAAARLLGFCEAAYVQRNAERRAVNEEAAFERASAIVRSALPAAECQALLDEGRRMPEEAVAACVFEPQPLEPSPA